MKIANKFSCWVADEVLLTFQTLRKPHFARVTFDVRAYIGAGVRNGGGEKQVRAEVD